MGTMSDAVRHAREGDFSQGVDFGILEWQQIRLTPSLRGWARWQMAAGAVKALAMISAPAGLLLPLGGDDFGSRMSGEGFHGDGLGTGVHLTFWFAAIGQAWVLLDWWRRGRERSGAAVACAVLALLSAMVAPWWFALGMSAHAAQGILAPIIATGLLAVAVLVAHLGASRPTVPDRREIELAQRVQALPEVEQQAMREERETILTILQERDLIDVARAEEARATPLGEWWRLDERSATTPS
jgi:hypothetical protein